MSFALRVRFSRNPGIFPILLIAVALIGCAPRIAPEGTAGDARPAVVGESLRMADGSQLPLRTWSPRTQEPKAIILALHGFNDTAMGFDSPASWMAAQGYSVYAYDQRGFGAAPHRGLWPGTAALVDDFGTAAALLKSRYPDTPIFALGVSMGAGVMLAAAGRDAMPPQLDGVVLAAPAVWAREEMPYYQRWALWLTAHTVPWLTLTGRALDVQASDNLIELRALGTDPMVLKATRIDAVLGLTNLMGEALRSGEALQIPALVLYGENDQIIPPDPMLALWQQLEGRDTTTLALYEEGWHMILRDLQAYTVWNDIAAWMEAAAEPLPSTADERARIAMARNSIPFPENAVLSQK